MFNTGKIKQLKQDKEKLQRQIQTLETITSGQKLVVAELKKRLEEYDELFKVKDQTVVIQQDGKLSKLLIGGKLIKNVTSIEMEKLGAGTLSNFKFGILADEVIIRKKGQ
nr:MAG TPA: hypothetical protein [Caudoviricetes sp.]